MVTYATSVKGHRLKSFADIRAALRQRGGKEWTEQLHQLLFQKLGDRDRTEYGEAHCELRDDDIPLVTVVLMHQDADSTVAPFERDTFVPAGWLTPGETPPAEWVCVGKEYYEAGHWYAVSTV
jgi:hypothetical protein